MVMAEVNARNFMMRRAEEGVLLITLGFLGLSDSGSLYYLHR